MDVRFSKINIFIVSSLLLSQPSIAMHKDKSWKKETPEEYRQRTGKKKETPEEYEQRHKLKNKTSEKQEIEEWRYPTPEEQIKTKLFYMKKALKESKEKIRKYEEEKNEKEKQKKRYEEEERREKEEKERIRRESEEEFNAWRQQCHAAREGHYKVDKSLSVSANTSSKRSSQRNSSSTTKKHGDYTDSSGVHIYTGPIFNNKGQVEGHGYVTPSGSSVGSFTPTGWD